VTEAENQLERKGPYQCSIREQTRCILIHTWQKEWKKMARMIYLDTNTLRKGERVSDS